MTSANVSLPHATIDAPRAITGRDAALTTLYLMCGPFVVLSQRYLTFSCNSLVICHYRALAGSLSSLLLAVLVDRQGLFALLRRGRTLPAVVLLGVLTGVGTLCTIEGIRYAGSVPASGKTFGISPSSIAPI